MIIKNIDIEYLMSHRYGWHKIIEELNKTVNSNIILVDFMDKYFNLWFELPKIINYNNITYNFINKDVYYHINDNNKEDIFVYYDKFNLYHIFKWYSEYNEFKLLKGDLINNLKKKINSDIINSDWIGILHYPEFISDMNYDSYESFENILKSNTFLESIKYCKCIITLSKYLKDYIYNILIKHNYNILIKVIYHPTDFNCKLFKYKSFIRNKKKKIIQIGFWMRKSNTIYNIESTKYIKYWLPGGKYWKEMFCKIYDNHNEYLMNKSVNIKLNLNNEEYDNLLSNNIILLDVFNSSANNTVLECIARNTPLLVCYHPAIVEYLGINYPLYFNSIKELNNIIESKNFNKKIKKSHLYLKNMNKDKFKINYYCDSFNNILNNI